MIKKKQNEKEMPIAALFCRTQPISESKNP